VTGVPGSRDKELLLQGGRIVKNGHKKSNPITCDLAAKPCEPDSTAWPRGDSVQGLMIRVRRCDDTALVEPGKIKLSKTLTNEH